MDAIRCAYKILDYLEQSIERSDVDYKDISAERLGVSNQMHTTVILGLLDLGHVFGAVRVSQYINCETLLDVDELHITLRGIEFLRAHRIFNRLA